jgi:hypothetical protein
MDHPHERLNSNEGFLRRCRPNGISQRCELGDQGHETRRCEVIVPIAWPERPGWA